MFRKIAILFAGVVLSVPALCAVASATPVAQAGQSWARIPVLQWHIGAEATTNCTKGPFWRVKVAITNPEALPMAFSYSASSNPVGWDNWTPGTDVPANTTITGSVVISTKVHEFTMTGSGAWYKNIPVQDDNGNWHDNYVKQDSKSFSIMKYQPEDCVPPTTTTTPTTEATTSTTVADTTTVATTVAPTTTVAPATTTSILPGGIVCAGNTVATQTCDTTAVLVTTTTQPVVQTASPVTTIAVPVNTVAEGTLAATGSDTVPLVGAAAVLFVIGLGLLIVRRDKTPNAS